MKHNNDFRYDLKVGKRGESVFYNMLENDLVEVKSEQSKIENNWINSGNCFVEFESRNKKSGLAHTQAKWWVINFMEGDNLCFNITMSVERLKQIAQDYYARNGFVKGGDSDTSKGVLVPIHALIRHIDHSDEEEYKIAGVKFSDLQAMAREQEKLEGDY
jgi:hypothetical protein